MRVIGDIFGLLVVASFVWIPFFWVWAFYHKIKCRKVEDCKNRKCRYWSWCNHNYAERKKEELELRKQMLMRNLGLTEEDLKKENDVEKGQDLRYSDFGSAS